MFEQGGSPIQHPTSKIPIPPNIFLYVNFSSRIKKTEVLLKKAVGPQQAAKRSTDFLSWPPVFFFLFDTGEQLIAGVVDTGDKHSFANISANFRKNSKWS